MADKIEDGGPAFPVPDSEATSLGYHGLSIRDWFAGLAINGLLACTIRYEGTGGNMAGYARVAYEVADAMLAARKEPRS